MNGIKIVIGWLIRGKEWLKSLKGLKFEEFEGFEEFEEFGEFEEFERLLNRSFL